MKICKDCRFEKSIKEFHKGRAICKKCVNIEREKYRGNNQDKIKEINRQYYLSNKIKVLSHNKEYNELHKESLSLYHKKYRENHRKELSTYHKMYRSNNQLELSQKRRDYEKERYHSDVKFKIKSNIKSRIKMAMNRNINFSTFELLGTKDIEFYKQYLESKFSPGMSWGNKNWEIDHVIPIAAFDLTDEFQRKIAFHYLNTRPTLKKENREKSDKYSEQDKLAYINRIKSYIS